MEIRIIYFRNTPYYIIMLSYGIVFMGQGEFETSVVLRAYQFIIM